MTNEIITTLNEQVANTIFETIKSQKNEGILFSDLLFEIQTKPSCKKLKIKELKNFLNQCVKENKITIEDVGEDQFILSIEPKNIHTGTVSSSGSKLFIIDDSTEKTFFYINENYQNLIEGDKISFIVSSSDVLNELLNTYHKSGLTSDFAINISIKEYSNNPIVCRSSRDRKGDLYFIPNNVNKYHNIRIEIDEPIKENIDAQLLSIRIINRDTKPMKGELVEILGSTKSASTQVATALVEHQIPHDWPHKVLEEIKNFSENVSDEDKLGHKDITNIPLITIDGEDSRDFDDAVYCEPLDREEKGWRLYVAIADVSYYVRPGSALDHEAYNRGNSVYFPDTVVPMLPEVLSNGLCSLNPNVDRLCMVCEMIVSSTGQLESYVFYPGVMHSHARMTYTKIHSIIEGNQALIEEYSDIYGDIINLYEMYKVLDKARKHRGAIEFESEEVKFLFNEQRLVEDICPIVRNESHKLIEECMILANIAAANFIENHKEKTVFRIHPKPDEKKIEFFRNFIAKYGLELEGGSEPSPKDYAKFVSKIEEREDAYVFNLVMLRSLAKAVYSPENCGHFGLALSQYAHFTSPIRRYPDLLLHREIKYLLALDQKQELKGKKTNLGGAHYEYATLSAYGAHCSETERRADEATYEVSLWLKCQFMQNKIGQTFIGTITNVASFGIFVMLDDWHIDGMIYVGNLGSDYFCYNHEDQVLVGTNTGLRYKIGEKLKVTIDDINMEERKINFRLVSKLNSKK